MKIKLLVTTLSSLIIFSSLTAFAAGEEDLTGAKEELRSTLIEEGIQNCKQNLSKALDLEFYDFLKFLEVNFQNKSSNSSLSNIAIGRYRDYKINVENLFAQIKTVEGTFAQQNAAYLDCIVIKDEYLKLAKSKLLEHIKKNSAQKKTIVLLEKYQAINSKLRDLNVEIAEMYASFMTFKERLPGFLQECIQK